MEKSITVGVVVPAPNSGLSDAHAARLQRLEHERDKPTAPIQTSRCVADIACTQLYVDGVLFSDVCAVEFSAKHVLLCVPVGEDHRAVTARLKAARNFRVVIDVGRNPGATVIDETLADFRFDRANYRCCTQHFGGIWVAELRFTAPLKNSSTGSDADEKVA